MRWWSARLSILVYPFWDDTDEANVVEALAPRAFGRLRSDWPETEHVIGLRLNLMKQPGKVLQRAVEVIGKALQHEAACRF